MGEKVLQTKIALLCKTQQEWAAMSSYVPLKGEVCIASIPLNTGSIHNAPTVLFKVGDGITSFADLNWASALAADVYAWAKKENLDFSDLSEEFKEELKTFINMYVDLSDYEKKEDAETSYAQLLEAINSEATRATEAESGLNTAISNEAARATEAEGSLQSAIEAEATARQNADTELSNSISTLSSNLSDEQTARIAGDNALDGKIEAEIERAKAEEAKKVNKDIIGTNGKAMIFNEADGGGAKFEHTDGTESFVGVNDGGENGLAAQIYADKLIDGKWTGAKLDVTNKGMYYTVGDKSAAERDVPENEIATKGDIAGGLEGLADIAHSGNVNDLIQTEGDVLILDCNL